MTTVTTNINILIVDENPVLDLGSPIEAAIVREGVIIVLVFGPPLPSPYKYIADALAHPERYDESNRNVYGVATNGEILWRIKSVASPAHPWHSFNRILVAGELTLIETSAEAFFRLQPKTGAISVYPMPRNFREFAKQVRDRGEVLSWHPFRLRGNCPHPWPPNITIEHARELLGQAEPQ